VFKKYKISKLNEQFGIKKRYFLFFHKWLTHDKVIIHNNIGYISTEIQIFTTIGDAIKKVKSLRREI
jgi:hypothetical protein